MILRGMSGSFMNQEIPVEGSLVLGRNKQSCNLVFPDSTKGVSRMHCKVEYNGGRAVLTDLGSSYGTFLNGTKIEPYQPKYLKGGDVFYLGENTNMFSCVDNGVRPAPQPSVSQPVQAAAPMAYETPNTEYEYGNSSEGNGVILGAVIVSVAIVIILFIL